MIGSDDFFEEKWNNHSIFLWCRNRGPKCFLLFWQKLKWQMISIWKCGKNASCKLLNFAVCLHSSNVFIYDIMYRVNHYWCLESIHTLLLSQSIPSIKRYGIHMDRLNKRVWINFKTSLTVHTVSYKHYWREFKNVLLLSNEHEAFKIYYMKFWLLQMLK